MFQNNDDLEIDLSDFGGEGGPSQESDANDLDFDMSDFEETISDNDENQEGDGTQTDEIKTDDEADEPNKQDKDEDAEGGEAPERDTTDNTLDEIENLLKDLDDDTSENLDEAQKVLAQIKDVEGAEGAVALIEQLQTSSKEDKATIDSLRASLDKLSKEKGDLSARNAELELYGGSDDTKLVYLNSHITKARSGDDNSKKKIIGILDDLRIELAGKTKEDEEQESTDDKISRFMSHNGSKVSPNTASVGGIDDFILELE